jgi:hypothetical protein
MREIDAFGDSRQLPSQIKEERSPSDQLLNIAIQNTQLPLAVFATSRESSESSSSEYRVWEASGIDVSAGSQSNTCTPSLLKKKQ